MQVNSSSNASLLSPLCYSSSTLYPDFFICFDDTISYIIFTVYTFTNLLLLLPLYNLVLWMGFRRWRHQCSVISGTTSHSDVFTYYMVSVEIIGVLGSVFCFSAINMCSLRMMLAGYYSISITYPAQTFFHCLTCLERYLAVCHPITYMGLRKAGGVKVRNISLGCVWLLCFGMTVLTALYFPDFPTTLFFAIVTISTSVVSFCSLSVLRVLIRLGLGKVGGHRERIDQSKKRAFHTIMAIMGTLMLRFCGLLVGNMMLDLATENGRNRCVALMSGMWLCIPSSLVLPLLFLQRAGTLTCSSRN